jgi:hypothetical protein
MSDPAEPKIPLPNAWHAYVKVAVLHVVSLAQYAAVYTRSWAADSSNARVRLAVENERLLQDIALLREELSIKDARMARIAPKRRPHYAPVDRMAILELKAALHGRSSKRPMPSSSRRKLSLHGSGELMKTVRMRSSRRSKQ